MINKLPKWMKILYDFFCKSSADKVGIYTAQASFFIILSVSPFILLLLNLIGLTSIDESLIVAGINAYFPDGIKSFTIQIVDEMYTNVSGTVLSVTAIAAIWASSKGFLAVMTGIYNIYKVHRNRSYIISRLASMIYTVIFVITIVVAMVLLVFGNKISDFAISIIPALSKLSIPTLITRYALSFLVLLIFFAIIYKMANFRHTTFLKILPGATFSAAGWIIFSAVFSIYIDNFSNMTYMYGSLTAFIMALLWLYFCIYIFFIGAELNVFNHPEIAGTETSNDKNVKSGNTITNSAETETTH